ncbi:hypothetical protein A1O3_08991 [Capronia epimyces CBS 606.96]|uniref:L-ornithine N(5)-oxygenase n=1 Tax=Capronia epimyces CBS 606.96 TaxID=1182542 RepID=W9XBK8_9EURO|nr:uncharacterized protein A1O3_08991 [Capronia epimyces CBS 606.96]EXJ77832.1 hypothetical protein A1O3_08991 [Capronia epimyces CBS 606.96]
MVAQVDSKANSQCGLAIPVPEKRSSYYPKSRPFDRHRPVKLIIVGAGIAGISAAILIPRKVRNLSYVVYEKNKRVGGAWEENKYPGVRCDVPAHTYQLSFAPNIRWSEYYPKGSEIRQYYQDVVDKYGVSEHLRVRHEVSKATWRDDLSQWEVTVKDLETGTTHMDFADFFLSAPGLLNKWSLPDIPGLQDEYQGHLCHTANWDPDFDYHGKRIAVIGNGASGLQILPNLLADAGHIDHYVRSKVWVAPAFRKDLLPATAENPGGEPYTEEQKDEWTNNPKAYLEYRRSLDIIFHPPWANQVKDSPQNRLVRERSTQTILERVGGDKAWLERLLPEYAPGCKRPTPAPGYIEAILDPKVEYITEKITRATSTGLVTADGKLREVDAIIAATGFRDGTIPRFPTIGKNGTDLSKYWAFDGPVGYPETYLGVMAPGFPNYFFIHQAQGNGAGGTVPMQCEMSATYIAKVIRKVQSQSYKTAVPSQEATNDFNDIVDGAFDNSVLSDSCNSWFKPGPGKTRITLHWPGTFHHRFDAYRDPRWEDFVFERQDDARANRFEYFGNGSAAFEETGSVLEFTNYLKEPGTVDLATLHENWNE